MFIIGYRTIMIPTLFNFSIGEEQESMELDGGKKRNEYYFFTFFWIPIIPLRCSKSVWKLGDTYYKRPISVRGKFVNQLFGLLGIFVIFVLLIITGNI